jgi:BirA family biotin operon repressor/biotin-[acetyl-CoA-carboxylase] ligase
MTIDAVRLVRETSIARVEYHPKLDSTNDRAALCAAQRGIELPALIVAEEQTAGRGRGANRWWTGPGSLAFSLLVDAKTVAAGESRSPLVALAAAVAVVDCVAPLLPKYQVGIHWPNDVHVRVLPSVSGERSRPSHPVRRISKSVPENWTDLEIRPTSDPSASFVESPETGDRKLAGILVEVLPDRRHVIGIGLNANNTLADAPAELRNTAATLRDLSGREYDRTGLLIDLWHCLERAFSQLREDPKELAARADSLCLQRGQSVTLCWTNQKVTGVCQGIAADGGILLETSDGLQTFLSGTAES